MAKMMYSVYMIEHKKHDYVATTPGLSPFERGALSTEGLDDARRDSIERFANRVGALVQGLEIEGERFAVMYLKGADSEGATNVTNEVLDEAGQAAGFDVKGALLSNSWQALFPLDEAAQSAFRIANPDVPKEVMADISTVAFGSLQTEQGTDWQLSVVDFPTTVERDGKKVQSTNRILSFIELELPVETPVVE